MFWIILILICYWIMPMAYKTALKYLGGKTAKTALVLADKSLSSIIDDKDLDKSFDDLSKRASK